MPRKACPTTSRCSLTSIDVAFETLARGFPLIAGVGARLLHVGCDQLPAPLTKLESGLGLSAGHGELVRTVRRWRRLDAQHLP